MTEPKYLVGRLISAAGGQADVFEITRREDGTRFAAKFPKTMFAHLPEVQERFTREASHYRFLHSFQRHPHVAHMVEMINWDGRQGIVLELMENSLESRLRRGLPDPEKIKAIRETALGLAHLHRYGITHRDVKPSNVLRCFDGRYVLSDLGCATVAGASALDLTRASIGTPSLMAPEQHGPWHYADARSDAYGLGTCIALAFLGRYPQQTPAEDGQSVQVEIGSKVEDLDQGFHDLLWRCLDPDANQRFGSMQEFVKEWDDLAKRGALATPPSLLEKVVKGVAAVGLFALVVSAIAKASK